ncbi:uncharacterized protein LOC107360895 [Tetranychus urticae]|uniref:LCN-type CS-alpha/beta domain-containing protein n=1 Tax=Tetranychus urticae TaxID=32264 RepID=T1K663_TETUR|nr:uncharacterized protein LOC107360895 [Tetranychus urticae]
MRSLFLHLLCLLFASFFKPGDFTGCRFMVDNCDEDCHDICKATCSKNFGVCAEEERISYCYCFETKPKEKWIHDWKSDEEPSSQSLSSHEDHHNSRSKSASDL